MPASIMENEKGANVEANIEDYARLAEGQSKRVAELEKTLGDNATEEQKIELFRETDKLRHYENAVSGIPHARAYLAANAARKSVLNRAVVQPI